VIITLVSLSAARGNWSTVPTWLINVVTAEHAGLAILHVDGQRTGTYVDASRREPESSVEHGSAFMKRALGARLRRASTGWEGKCHVI
jgi:hypothetical protein